jgi:hypothetical protein
MSKDKPTEVAPVVSDGVSATASTGAAKSWKGKSYPATLDIPPPILERIGAITTHWALVEFKLAGMQYRLLGMNRKEGRTYDQGNTPKGCY